MRIALFSNDIVWESVNNNLITCEEHIRDFINRVVSVDLIVLPEFFSTGFTMNHKISESIDGESVNWMIDISKEFNCAILASIPIKEENNLYNRAFFVKPDGSYICYNKRHLFRYGGEDRVYTPGESVMIVNFKEMNIAVQICYDLRFPVWARNIDLSYDLMINIANWPDKRSDVKEPLCRARAIENLSYFAFVNRCGSDPDNNYNGERYLFNYKGKEEIPLIKTNFFSLYNIENAQLHQYRENFQAWRDADNFVITK
ncbi:MAG: nitrilase-related carbon-nitrogen hydrolase [Bacteroidales bacterium]